MGWYDDCERCTGGDEMRFTECEYHPGYKTVCNECGWCQKCEQYEE
ncbi:hypothetical protein [Fredinandcohnia onubensis]|nr:hypothetical protein [Fredinandcohnia onubensis]